MHRRCSAWCSCSRGTWGPPTRTPWNSPSWTCGGRWSSIVWASMSRRSPREPCRRFVSGWWSTTWTACWLSAPRRWCATGWPRRERGSRCRRPCGWRWTAALWQGPGALKTRSTCSATRRVTSCRPCRRSPSARRKRSAARQASRCSSRRASRLGSTSTGATLGRRRRRSRSLNNRWDR
jgi:hypothetical protein